MTKKTMFCVNSNPAMLKYTLSQLGSIGTRSNLFIELCKVYGVSCPTESESFATLIVSMYQTHNMITDTSTRRNVILHPEFVSRFSIFIKDGGDYKDVSAFVLTMSQFIPDSIIVPPSYPFNYRSSEESITSRRKMIFDEMVTTLSCHDGNFTDIKMEDICHCYALYSRLFFDNRLPTSVCFATSTRMTSSAASFTHRRIDNKATSLKITVSVPVLMRPFSEVHAQSVGGIVVKSRLAALQLALEHEIVHMLLALSPDYLKGTAQKKKSPEMTSHGVFFKQVISGLFGHTKCSHAITELHPDTVSTHSQTYSKSTMKVGDTASFMMKTDRITGNVIKLNPKKVRIVCGNASYDVPYELVIA